MKKNEKRAVWFLLTSLLCVFVLTMLLLIQGVSKLYYAAGGGLLCLQLFGLFRSMTKETEKESPRMKTIGRLNLILSLSVFFFAAATYLMMIPQFHLPLKADAEGDIAKLDMAKVQSAENSYVFKTDNDLYLIFPAYTSVQYAFDERPSMADSSITFYCASAFYEQNEIGFRHANVTGDHVHDGILYDGSKNFSGGAFTYFDREAHFTRDNPQQALSDAASHGGEGFMQFMPIIDGQLYPLILGKQRCYRVLAELNGRLCIVEASKPIYYNDFIQKVLNLGVTNAAYLDMGGKSTYSEYRNEKGNAVKLFGGLPNPVIHSWVVFRK